jgi:hypothetical protein
MLYSLRKSHRNPAPLRAFYNEFEIYPVWSAHGPPTYNLSGIKFIKELINVNNYKTRLPQEQTTCC